MYVHCTCLCAFMHTMHVCECVCTQAKEGLRSLELDLQAVESHHVGADSPPQVLCRKSTLT